MKGVVSVYLMGCSELNWKTVLKSSLTFLGRYDEISNILGDSVVVELSPYDLTRGRIIYRLKQNNPSKNRIVI
jgi:hypothetical protein